MLPSNSRSMMVLECFVRMHWERRASEKLLVCMYILGMLRSVCQLPDGECVHFGSVAFVCTSLSAKLCPFSVDAVLLDIVFKNLSTSTYFYTFMETFVENSCAKTALAKDSAVLVFLSDLVKLISCIMNIVSQIAVSAMCKRAIHVLFICLAGAFSLVILAFCPFHFHN